MSITYTRNQFSKIFGVSSESLRYLEKVGVITVTHNQNNNYIEYEENQIPVIISVKLFQSLGVPLKDITNAFQGNPKEHLELMDNCLKYLHDMESKIQNKIYFISDIRNIFATEITKINQVNIVEEESWEYIRFTKENSDIVTLSMKYLPNTSVMILIDQDQVNCELPLVQTAMFLDLRAEPNKELKEKIGNNKALERTKEGTCIHKVIFKEKPLDIHKIDYEDMLVYMTEHNYTMKSGIFGVLMGPQDKGFYIRLFVPVQ